MTGSRPGYGPAEDPDEVRGGQSRAAAASADTGDGAVLDRVLTGPQMRALVAPERIGTGEPADLSARVFRRCDLTGADLRGLDLGRVVFDRCVLSEARLTGCGLDGARVTGGQWVNTELVDADLTDVVFDGVDLARARLRGALLADARFQDCRMIGVDLTALRGLASSLTLHGCNLQLANLTELHLRGWRIAGCDLSEAELWGADLREAVFTDCRLRDLDLSNTRLDGADLRSSDLGELGADSPRQLRGAVISTAQATAVCGALGITVLD